MPLIFMDLIKREDLWDNPDWLFVFGDNIAKRGFGGLAKVCRGEFNAIGVPTKQYPSNSDGAFLKDADLVRWRVHSAPSRHRIEEALAEGRTVVFPSAGIGTGLAKLEEHAPLIWAELQKWLDRLRQDFYNSGP